MAAKRFLRSYRLTMMTSIYSTMVVTPPFTIEFDVQRDFMSSANVCMIRIMNLNEHNRNLLMKDPTEVIGYRSVELAAGYGDQLIKIFSGNMTRCWSVREGDTWVTSLECFDGGAAIAQAITNQPVGPRTPNQQIVERLIKDLAPYGVSRGVVGTVTGTTSRSTALNGPTTKLLTDFTKGTFFIDQGKANVLGDNECIGQVVQIDADTGLQGTPILEQYKLSFTMVFEPKLNIGQVIQLTSQIDRFNGYYRVASIKHTGTISEFVGGDCKTRISCQYGKQFLGLLQ